MTRTIKRPTNNYTYSSAAHGRFAPSVNLGNLINYFDRVEYSRPIVTVTIDDVDSRVTRSVKWKKSDIVCGTIINIKCARKQYIIKYKIIENMRIRNSSGKKFKKIRMTNDRSMASCTGFRFTLSYRITY